MADVVGYSKMMGENEELTIEVLRGHREIFDEMLKQHRGRIFNTAGDAILAEFPSAVDAVRCATEVQAALRTRNDHLPAEQRMWFRIGINLGDVIVQGSDLLGDGVNVAARIQTVAEPGGVCIAGSVYDQIQNKLSLHFRQLGEKSFKNIAQPIRTFSIEDTSTEGIAYPGMRRASRRKLPVAAGAAIVALIALGAGGYWIFRDHEARVAEEARIAAESRIAADAQRKAELDRVAAEAAQHESKLQAELQAARNSLQQAEAGKRKADLDRAAAESARREAKLQGELIAAKDALLRAEQSEKKADLDSKNATAALLLAEKAARLGAERGAKGSTGASPKSTTPPQVASLAQAPAAPPADASSRASIAPKVDASVAGGDAARFDGNYQAHFCNTGEGGEAVGRCWNAPFTVQRGKLSATWTNRMTENLVHANGTIAPDGGVKLTIDGYHRDGRPLRATLTGSGANDKIAVSGSWQNRVAISGNLTRVH